MWIPFVIFFLGYFLTWRKSQLDKKKEVQVYRDLFINWITLAKTRTMQQSKNCSTFSKALLDSEFIDAAPFKSAPMMYSKLNAINTDKIINAFVFNSTGLHTKKLENFNKLIANINFLDRIETELKEKYDKSTLDLLSVNDMYNNSFIQIEKIYLKKLNEIGRDANHPDRRYVKIVGDFMQEWQLKAPDSGNGVSAAFTFDRLFKPILDFVTPSFQKDIGNKFLLELSDELTTIMIVKKRWIAYKNGHSQIFENYGTSINDSYSDLEGCLVFFQSTKVLNFWRIK